MELAKDQNIRVVCDDTDVFMLTLAKLDKTNEFSVYLNQPKLKRNINMIDLVNIIPERVRSNILVIHAITGCETTLFLFGVRKSKLFKKVVMDKDYKDDLFQRFYEPDCGDLSELKDVCEKIIMSLCSYCPNCETLDELRVKSF